MLATAIAERTPSAPQRRSTATPRQAAAARQLGQPLMVSEMMPCAIKTLEAKDHIFREGDPATHMYQVEVGHVCIYHMLSDGRRQVVDFAYPGDYIALGAMREHATSAQATTRTSVRCIPLSSLNDLMQHDARIGVNICQALSHELSATRELLFTISQRTAPERLARFLLALSRRNERRGMAPNEIVLPMTRTDIADLLGLTIETVSRTFSKFRADGLIDLEQCILVTIVDPAGLAIAAGEGRNADE